MTDESAPLYKNITLKAMVNKTIFEKSLTISESKLRVLQKISDKIENISAAHLLMRMKVKTKKLRLRIKDMFD